MVVSIMLSPFKKYRGGRVLNVKNHEDNYDKQCVDIRPFKQKSFECSQSSSG